MESKSCRNCKQIKLVSVFHRNKYRKDGYHYDCKDCRIEESKKRYLRHKNSIDARNKHYVREHPIRRRAILQRYRCKAAGIEGDVTANEWRDVLRQQKFRCRSCKRKTALEMDHILPVSVGGKHLQENIQALCMPCHRKKDGVLYRRQDYYEEIY